LTSQAGFTITDDLMLDADYFFCGGKVVEVHPARLLVLSTFATGFITDRLSAPNAVMEQSGGLNGTVHEALTAKSHRRQPLVSICNDPGLSHGPRSPVRLVLAA
jgi:hypothetical protein